MEDQPSLLIMSYVSSVNCLLFLMNVCTAYDNNIF
jgi:hypothetical protein